jgi:hypothetical protein
VQVPYDNEDEDKALNLGPSLFDALKKKPDTEARRQRLARQLDLPSFAIGVDTEAEAEREARLQAINPSQFTIAAPRTSSFLSVPENADVAHDNVENMFSFETMFRMAKNTPAAIGVAPLSYSQGLFGSMTMLSDASDAINIFRYIDPKGYQKRLADRRAFEKQFNADAERVQDQIRPKGLSMAEDAYYSGIESGTQSVISLLAGPLGLGAMVANTAGSSYQRALDEGLSPLQAGIYATTQGGIELYTEKTPFLGLLEDVKIGTPFFKTVIDYVRKEFVGEQVATFGQDFVDLISLPSNRDKTFGEFLKERPDAALSTAISTLVGGGFTASVYKATDYALNASDRQMAKMERAAAVKEWTDKASKLAEVDKLLQRAPETFKQFIDEVAADGAVSDLYVDRDVLLQAIEDTGIEAPAEVASQLSTATPGSDIRIPAGEFMTYLATPEVYAKLGDHLKTEPSGMTYAQAQEQGKDALAALTATFEGVLTETLKDDEFRASRDRVQDRLFKEQQVAGRFDDTVSRQYAFVGAQMVSVMAKRAGITPEELLAKKALSTKAGDSRAGKKIFAEGGPRVPPTYDRANDPDGYRDMAEQMVMEEQQYTEEELADPQTKREFDIQSRAKFDQLIENNYTPPSTGESNDTRRAVGNQAEAGAVRDGGGVSGGERLLGEQGQPDTGTEERPLTGAPTRIKVDGQVLTFGPFAPAREAARKYMESTGREYTPVQTYQKVDIPFAERVAEAFDEMADDPTNPEVAAAYQAMIEETVAQWQFIKATGLVVEFIEGDDPYGNPWNAILDVVNNNHLYVFPSDTGFGDGVSAADYDVAQQPMLADAPGEFFGGKQAKYNDIFRAVHDYFGHIKDGLGFRGNGEENAYRSHAQMYSPLARRAMAVETRGQNSYLNYGPNREFNATANAAETMYAPQKVGLLPDWVVEERLDDPEDQVLNQYIRNEPYPDNPFPDDRVSTRLPTNKGSRENPDREFLNVSTEAMEMAPDVFAHNANLLLTYEGFVTDAVKPADIVEAYIQFATDNLLWLHDQIPQEIRDRSKLWYDGARALTLKWSEQYDQPPRVIAAVIAALSPQKDWYQNVSMAERILGITLYKADTKMSNQQFDMAYELYIGAQERENIKLIAKGKEPKVIKDDVRAVVESLRNMTLNELNTPTQRAMWVRSYDQTYNPRGYRVTTPEGEFVGKATGKTAWGSNVEIAKAIEAIRNPSRDNISKLMGTKHKVRSFYNNIIAPIAGEDVTIDTHAVAAAHLRPHSGSSAEVHHNFGSSPEKKKQGPNWQPAKNANEYGIQGVYAFNADAYRRAAAARGLLPREMQSITWEAIRGLFEKSAKTAKGEASLTNLVNLEWIKYQDGTQTLEETRNAILTLAGGIESPTWLGYDYSAAQTVGLSSYDGELASPELSRGRAGQLGIGGGDTGRIASGVGGNDLVDEGVLNQYDPGLAGFRSTLYDTVRDKGPNKATASDWKGLLDNATGVKKEEIEDTGLYEFLDIRGLAELNADGQPIPQMVSKSDVLSFIEQNGARLEERILSEDAELDYDDPRYYEIEEQIAKEVREEQFDDEYVEPNYDVYYGIEVDGVIVRTDRQENASWFVGDEDDTDWTEYQGNDEEGYRIISGPHDTVENALVARRGELRAHRAAALDQFEMSEDLFDYIADRAATQFDSEYRETVSPKFGDYVLQGALNYKEWLFALKGMDDEFKGGHWNSKLSNVMAHARTSDRTDANGSKTLVLEEVQTDWHQQARGTKEAPGPGYKTKIDPVEKQRASDEYDAAVNERNKAMDKLEDASIAFFNEAKSSGLEEFLVSEATRAEDKLNDIEAEYRKTNKFVGNVAEYRDLQNLVYKTRQAASVFLRYRSRGFWPSDGQVAAILRGAHNMPNFEDALLPSGLFGTVLIKGIAANNEYNDAANEVYKAQTKLDDVMQQGRLPNAPLKKAWSKLIVRRLIKYAAENGYDRVAIQSGKVTSQVSSGDNRAAWFYDENLKNITNDLIKKSGQKMVKEPLYNTPEYRMLNRNGAPEPAMFEDRVTGKTEHVEVLFLDINDAIKAEFSAPLPLYQEQKEGPRGTFNPATGVITLNKNANLSTWLHELGHYQLELLAELSSGADANPQIKADMEAVLSWFSTDLPEPITLEMWQGMTLDEKRVYHEQFARGFEAYLFEGKAPSKELRSVFQKFREWMIGVYKELKALRVELNDEVRGVFDRMLATDEAIAAAQKGRGMQAAFTNRPEGMTEDEWAAYQRIQQEATDEAIDGLQTRSLRDMKWVAAMRSRVIYELQRSARELYKSVKAEVASEVMQEPVYMAREYLKYGRLYGDEPSPDPRKMDLEMLKAMFPENSGIDLTPLTRGGKYGLTQQDGVHPDVIADMFGFESGDAMVRQLLSAEPMNDKITAITDKRMLERYGDIKDQAALDAAADEIIHNDARARAVHTELSYAEKVLGKKTPLIQAARAFAQNLVDRTILRNLRPDLAESAAERARRAAQTALKNDDMEQFAAQKRNELVHIQTVRAQQKAKEELSSTLSFFARIVTAKDEGLAKRRDLNLVMAARAILAAHGIGRKSQNPQEYLDRALAYDPEVGNQLKLDVAAATIGATGDFKDLTVEQMRALRDVVKQLWDLAKSTKEIEIGADTVAMDDAVAQLIKELEDGPDPKYVGMGMDQAVNDTALMLPGGGLGLPILGVNALLRRVEGWATLKGEAWSRFTFRLVSNAANQYRLALQGAVTRYREILEPISADLKLQKIDGREINYTFGSDGTGIGMAELLGALRHTGNPSNLKKLLIGRGWADINPDGSMDTTRWDAFLARMHKEGILQKRHWDFIQAEWDLHDSLKPQAQKAHKAMYGRYFAEVTAAEVTTPFGVYKGGYVPASTDPNLVDDAALRKEAEDMFGGGSALFPAPANGMTKSRVENYNEPLALNIGMVPSQIARALRFAYLGPAIRDVNRLLRRKDLRSVLKGYDPVAITDVLMPWLERSASQQVVTPAKGRYGRIVDEGLKAIRSRTSLALLFFNLSNTLQNITGLAPAALRTGKRNLLKASMTYLRDPTGTSERIANLSVMMAQRNSTQFDELQAEMRNIILKPNLFQKAQDWSAANAQWLQRGLQNVLDMMVWQAAYNRAIEEQNTDPVGFADSAVRETMGSFGAEDVSAFETGTAASRAFTLFYSYFNTQANLLGNEFAKAPTAARGFEVFMLGVFAPALGSMIIAQALKGNLFDDGDDDEEDGLMTAIEMFFTAPLAYMAGFIPVLGPAAIAIANTFDDKPFNDRLSLSPVFSVVESALKLPKAYADWAAGEDISNGKMIRDTAMLVTLATGIPVSAIARPVSYAVSVAEGDVEPTDPFDYARGLVTGVASNPSKE